VTGDGGKPAQGVAPLSAADWLDAALASSTGAAFWGALSPLEAAGCPSLLRPCSPPDAESLHRVVLAHAPAPVAHRGAGPEHVGLVEVPASSPA
jgi:hypothetical protein